MNAKSQHAPPPVSEFAAGTLALAAVALITFVGVKSSPRLEMPSAPPASTGVPASPVELASIGASPRESVRSVNGAGAPHKRKPKPPRTREAAIPSPAATERDPLRRSDTIAIQGRLHDLGYYSDEGDGVWGAASRNALRDFKSLNGLQQDDRWDRETEERLWSSRSIPATSTFIGGWAVKATECRQRTAGGQVITINSAGAETNAAKCDFHSLRQESANRWRVRASCAADGRSWSANISLTLNGSNLRWSSERGSDTYLRCPKS